MRKQRWIGFCTAAIYTLSLCGGAVPAYATETGADATHVSALDGSFIQPWLYANWDEERWISEMEILRETGIDTLIMGDVANQSADDSWTVFYPSQLDFLQGGFAYNAIDSLMHYCDLYDIHVYLGMGLDCNWNSDLTTAEGLSANRDYMNKCNQITSELYALYKEKYPETYYGFYFVTELYNTYYMETDYGTQLYTDGLAEMFGTVIENCNRLDPTMPLLFSPYVNIFGYGFASINLDRFTEFWAQALTKIPFRDGDMLCPQDSCGGGGNDISHLGAWTAAYRNAVDRANAARGTKLLLGTNAELFVSPDATRMSNPHGVSYVGTKTVDDFAKRLELARPYVDSLFCFAYSHHYSPNNEAPGFHRAFVQYLKDGTIETNPPTPPTVVKTEVVTAENAPHLQLSFYGMTDDTDVGQINIYKDGALYDYLVPGVNNGATGQNHAQNVWVDYDFTVAADRAVYEIEALDVCGNAAPRVSYAVTPENTANGATADSAPNVEAAQTWELSALDCLTYNVTDGGVRITGCRKDVESIVIPDTIAGKPVTVIDWYAFENCKRLHRVTIPDTVTHISRFAFVHCTALTEINLPASLYAIEQYAFFDCPMLCGIALPASLAVIEPRAFSGCASLTAITIPAACKQVGEYAFFGCDALDVIHVVAGDTEFGLRAAGYTYTGGYQLQSGFVLSAAEGSAVADYAAKNGILLRSAVTAGDLNLDKAVGIADVVLLQKYLLRAASLTTTQARAAELDGDGVVSGYDLSRLKRRLLIAAAGK